MLKLHCEISYCPGDHRVLYDRRSPADSRTPTVKSQKKADDRYGDVDPDDELVLSRTAPVAAHTTFNDERLGLSATALTELENPLYVSERAVEWSQRWASGEH